MTIRNHHEVALALSLSFVAEVPPCEPAEQKRLLNRFYSALMALLARADAMQNLPRTQPQPSQN